MTMTETLIRVVAKPVTAYWAVFDDIDEDTGREITSVWYPTQEEAVRSWAPHGFERIEKGDARIRELTLILDRLKAAFSTGGSAAVSLELADMEHARAEHNLFDAQASIDIANAESQEGAVKVEFGRYLPCRTFRDPTFENWPISGLHMDILFDKEFPAGDGVSEPAGAREMQDQLRVSFSHQEGLKFHSDTGRPDYSITRYVATVEASHQHHYDVTISQETFEAILEQHTSRFIEDQSLSTIGYRLVRDQEVVDTAAIEKGQKSG